jgi:Fur family iron response transcriptional regulator
MDATTIRRLEQHGIRASAQRAAIAQWVLATEIHPSADEVWSAVRKTLPMVSRATVYNTLKLFVEKGLLRELVLAPGCIVYDPKMEPHHHFIEDDNGAIHDVPWSALTVQRVGDLEGYDVREFSVVLHGRRRGGRRR